MTDAKNQLEEYVRGMSADELAQFAAFIAARAGASPDAPAPGVRQYVGARYVPVFADPLEWSSAQGYEPLTIVAYQGNSYTSMQSVPAGIDITNTEYWAQTGNYNAQIEAYRQEVLNYANKVDGILSNAAFVSLADIGGKANDPMFDNSTVINGYFTREKAYSQVLYVPEGVWYINTSLDLTWCEIVCEGTFKCASTFSASTYATSTFTSVPYAVMIGYGAEGDYTFDTDLDTFITRKSWALNLDCNLVTNLTGVVMHRTWKCHLTADIYNALKYGVFTGLYITESEIDASVGIFHQHGTTVVGDTGIVVRAPDAILNNIITMHYLCGVDFQAPNTILNYWHGYGYYDAAKNGVGIRFSTGGAFVIGTVFNDGCMYCLDFKPGKYRPSAYIKQYFEIGRTAKNQMYLVDNFDCSWCWLTIDNLDIPFDNDDTVIKNFICNYLVRMPVQHHAGPKYMHMKLGLSPKRLVTFGSPNDPYWDAFDVWNLPICETPIVDIQSNQAGFTKAVLNAKHIYAIDESPLYKNTAGRVEISTHDNFTSFSSSSAGMRVELRGDNAIYENNVQSVGGEGSTQVNINVAQIPATFQTITLN